MFLVKYILFQLYLLLPYEMFLSRTSLNGIATQVHLNGFNL